MIWAFQCLLFQIKLGWYFNNGSFLICLTHPWCCLGDVVVQMLWASLSVYLSVVQSPWNGLACWTGFTTVFFPRKVESNWNGHIFLPSSSRFPYLHMSLNLHYLWHSIYLFFTLYIPWHVSHLLLQSLHYPHLLLSICFEKVRRNG